MGMTALPAVCVASNRMPLEQGGDQRRVAVV
jgi:hypothetical protein